MKFALVKQDLYQDLYVCGKHPSAAEALQSTLMRTGPLGLFADYDTDFIIVKENKARECRNYKFSLRISKNLKNQLQTLPANKLSAEYFSYLKPLSSNSHADFSVEADSIDWSIYDIVICINIPIPRKITKKYSNTLWCYMFGEASYTNPLPIKGYDVILTQNLTGEVANSLGVVDFPYTFLTKNTLERIGNTLFPSIKEKKGVYAEINCTEQRPVTDVPKLDFVKQLGHELLFHDQNILENLKRLYQSKYFVKLGGRKIRGNSIIEAISAGTLVLMDPKDIKHSQLLPKETWVKNQRDIENIITELDSNPQKYLELLNKQRELLELFVIDTPMESLKNCLDEKHAGKRIQYPKKIDIFKTSLKKIIRRIIM